MEKNVVITVDVFKRLLDITRNVDNFRGEMSLAADVILFSLLNDCMPLSRVLKSKKNDIPEDDSDLQSIVKRQNNGRRQYIFKLGGPKATPKQLSLLIQQLIKRLFTFNSIPNVENVFDVIEGAWAFAALKCGATGSEIVSILGRVPKMLPILELCIAKEIDSNRKTLIKKNIRDLLVSNPIRWFAMGLRSGVKFDEVKERINKYKTEYPDVKLFYPYEEIAKRTKKKVIYKKKPFIAEVVFFNCRTSDATRLMSKLRDLAWCYTNTGKTGDPFAYISQEQFNRFQQTIARFTTDYEVSSIGEMELKENDRVIVVGGLFNGMEADFKNIETTVDKDIVYRLNIIGDNGFEWRVRVDSRVVQKDKAV